jgi:1,4-alpha-glucan branching enzyme
VTEEKEHTMAVVADKKTTEVTFILSGHPDAKQVYLAGDFNQWDPKKQRMSKYRDGSFKARIALAPGAYQYKFVADGVLLIDPAACEQVKNELGTVNSLVRVG